MKTSDFRRFLQTVALEHHKTGGRVFFSPNSYSMNKDNSINTIHTRVFSSIISMIGLLERYLN
ncbi:hypothetical protein PsAD2_03154 [Pseudovibrio axinellae]|uniref:Uncharacterized protein n=1 Tax=Pseudovibrio axinellae TaxID=989403 RepID=A0A165X2R4_9HYPH|nr:hypothetical protein PsAD2_03154 [Pseudovibrio axinellae]